MFSDLSDRTLQVAFAALVLAAAVPSFAQEAERTVKVSATSVTTVSVAAGKTTEVNYDGETFKSLKLTVGDDQQLDYTVTRGGEFLSSGRTGVLEVTSDGKSTYTVQLTNLNKTAVTAEFTKTGGGSSI